ncbi:MAG TPA: YCF48-related protein [Nevskiaceae bacterium]|nr:YCF48-related protein [Nevskiaceae bacterium]
MAFDSSSARGIEHRVLSRMHVAELIVPVARSMHLSRFFAIFGIVACAALLPCFGANATVAAGNAFRPPLQVPAPRGVQPISSPLVAVAKAGKRLVAVGQRGDIVYSDDRGQHWTQARVPVSVDLTALSFPTPEQGWVVGQNGVVLHSDDGGASWSVQLTGFQLAKQLVADYEAMSKSAMPDSPAAKAVGLELRNVKFMARDAPALTLLDVWFKSAQVGFVVGQFNIILKTTDGGKSWTPLGYQVPTQESHHLYSVRGTDSGLYIAGEQGLLLYKAAGATAFQVVHTPYEGSFFGVAVGDGAVLIYGLQGHAYLSRDNGTHWTQLTVPTQSTFTSGAMVGGRIVLATASGDLFVGSTQTLQMKLVDDHGDPAIYGLAMLGNDTVVTVGPSAPEVIGLENTK